MKKLWFMINMINIQVDKCEYESLYYYESLMGINVWVIR